jgi:3-oxoacyl-[acyl-carrier-protein] synthase II
MVLAMRSALRDAGLNPSDIGHVNAHGLGDVETDRDEAAAILEVFGVAGKSVPVTAVKSLIGNSGSGAGMIEVAASLLSLQQGMIPPTLNFEEPDSTCPLNVVGKQPVSTSNKVFLSVNVTRMGQASATVITAV